MDITTAKRISHIEATYLPAPVFKKGVPRVTRHIVDIAPARADDVLGKKFMTSKELGCFSVQEQRVNACHKLIAENCEAAQRKAQLTATKKASELIAIGKDPAPAFQEIETMRQRLAGAKAALYLLAADVTATLRPFLIRAEQELAAMRPKLEKDILQKAREMGFDVAPDCPQILAIGCLHGHIARVIHQGASYGNRPSDLLNVLGFSLNN